MPKSTNFTYLLTYLLNIDIDIAIFCQYRIDIVSKFKKRYRSTTNKITTKIQCDKLGATRESLNVTP